MSARFETATVHDLVAALRTHPTAQPNLDWIGLRDDDGSLIGVHGAHHGAGASTISVALTDALSGRGVGEVTLLDLAAQPLFGASEAIGARADLGLRGWTGGRRGAVRIAAPSGCRDVTDVIDGPTVVDVCGHGRTFNLDVLVCRATVLSVRRAESLLAGSPDCCVAVVGASRWPAPVKAGLGPAMAAAWSSGRTVFLPHEPALEVDGLSAEPLPRSTLRSAGRLLDLLAERHNTDTQSDPSRSLG